jgi:hypothetical protein
MLPLACIKTQDRPVWRVAPGARPPPFTPRSFPTIGSEARLNVRKAQDDAPRDEYYKKKEKINKLKNNNRRHPRASMTA